LKCMQAGNKYHNPTKHFTALLGLYCSFDTDFK